MRKTLQPLSKFDLSRRSGGGAFDPASLFSGGEVGAIWDASTITPVAPGTEVLLVQDLSPNNYDATGTGGTAMSYEIDGNGKPYLKSDGTDFLQFNVAAFGTGQPVELMAAFTLDANGSFPAIFGNNSTTVGLTMGFNGVTRIPRSAIAGGTAGLVAALGSTALTLGVPGVAGLSYTDNTLQHRIDGTVVAQEISTGTFAVNTQGRIARFDPAVNCPIRFYAGVIIRRELTLTERNALGAWLAAKNGATYAPQPAPVDKVYALGDSTVATHASGSALMTFFASSYAEASLAVAGHTIAQQQTVWKNYVVSDTTPKWAIIQIGLNDLDPAEAASVAIARLQALVTAVRNKAGAACKILISQMIPCRARLIVLYGGVNGPIAYTKWLDMNAAIAGGGATPITGVDGRITAHVALMNDGAGNLLGAYDSGDGIHPNNTGRAVNAAEWVNALTGLGITV